MVVDLSAGSFSTYFSASIIIFKTNATARIPDPNKKWYNAIVSENPRDFNAEEIKEAIASGLSVKQALYDLGVYTLCSKTSRRIQQKCAWCQTN